MRIHLVLVLGMLPLAVDAAQKTLAPDVLPPIGTTQLMKSLKAAEGHARHVWRDTPPLNADGTVNAYVEIEKDDRRKWEFDMRAAARAIDRVMPGSIGGYPVNYGFVPQTVSYDGDPFDVLVLGPPIAGGTLVRAVIVGLMLMEDEKGLDSKVVVSPLARDGRPRHSLTPGDQTRIGRYFALYKQHEAGKYSKVPGWGSADEGRAHVTTTHAFFLHCRQRAGRPCRLPDRPVP
jgi:inorganic pyrophosphatase